MGYHRGKRAFLGPCSTPDGIEVEIDSGSSLLVTKAGLTCSTPDGIEVEIEGTDGINVLTLSCGVLNA